MTGFWCELTSFLHEFIEIKTWQKGMVTNGKQDQEEKKETSKTAAEIAVKKFYAYYQLSYSAF